MKCEVCGMDYGLSHHCSGIPALVTLEESAPPPTGFSPGYYLALAFNIARWDDIAIRRASRDSNAIYYGAVLWVVAAMLIMTGLALPRILGAIHFGGPAMIIGAIVGLSFGLAGIGVFPIFKPLPCPLLFKVVFFCHGRLFGRVRTL